jgi:hypothetical protein
MGDAVSDVVVEKRGCALEHSRARAGPVGGSGSRGHPRGSQTVRSGAQGTFQAYFAGQLLNAGSKYTPRRLALIGTKSIESTSCRIGASAKTIG